MTYIDTVWMDPDLSARITEELRRADAQPEPCKILPSDLPAAPAYEGDA